MTTIANHLHTALTNARCCDPFTPCATCQTRRTTYTAIRHTERVAALTLTPRIPQPRTALSRRLAQVGSAA